REVVEALGRARPRDREPPHLQAGHRGFARRVDVLPAQVIHRAGGEHLHLVPLREVLGDPARVQLRPADDLLAEALDDEAHPHRGGRSAFSRSSASQRCRSACSSTCKRAVSRTLLWSRWAKYRLTWACRFRRWSVYSRTNGRTTFLARMRARPARPGRVVRIR